MPDPVGDVRKAAIATLYLADVQVPEIAERFGMTEAAVNACLDETIRRDGQKPILEIVRVNRDDKRLR